MSATFRLLLRSAALGLTALGLCVAPASAATPLRLAAGSIPAPLSVKSTTTPASISPRGTVRRITLTLSAPRGVTARFKQGKRSVRTLSIAQLRAKRTVTISVRRAGNGPTTGTLRLRATARGRGSATTKIPFGNPATPPNATSPGSKPSAPAKLTGRTFWGTTYRLTGNPQNSMIFVTDSLAFAGDASTTAYQDGAVAPTCAGPSDVCKPYTYDASTGALTIDGKPATLTGRRLDWNQNTYGEFGAPPAGTTFNGTVTFANGYGVCPLSCTYVREDLTFKPDGTFARSSLVSGTSPPVDFTVLPADERGTYAVRGDQTILLAFADGKTRTRTVAMRVGDDGTLGPVTDGLILGGEGYFDISK